MKRLLFSLVLVLASRTAFAQCPPFPARGVQIIDALYSARLAEGTDDERRALTRLFIEQLVFESPSDGWTRKSADPGRPESKDSIARVAAGRLCNWDWQNGTTRRRQVQAGDIGDDITGQNPIPTAGVNHLTEPGPGPGPQPVPVPIPGIDLSGVYSRLDGLTLKGNELASQLERIYADLAARDVALTTQLQGVDARLEKHDAEPSWLGRVLRSPAFYAIVGPALTFLGTRQATNKNDPKPSTP